MPKSYGVLNAERKLLRAAMKCYQESQEFGEFEDAELKDAAIAYGEVQSRQSGVKE